MNQIKLIVLLLCFGLLSGDVRADQEKTIKIGALLDLTGEYAMFGVAFREGAELAVENINGNKTLGDHSLRLVIEDTHYNMTQTHTAAVKLTSVDQVFGAIISTYTEVMVAGPVFERAKTPIVNLWDSAPEIEAIGTYTFGIGAWTPSATDVASQFSRESLQAKTAVTIATNGAWSLSTAQDFAKKFESAGGKVLGQYELNPTDTDFRTVILKAITLNPDVIYTPVADNIVPFFQQLHKSPYKGKVITSDIMNDELIKAAGDGVEGIYQTMPGDPDNEATKEMLNRYKQKFNKECTQILMTAWAYDAVNILAKAIKAANYDRTKINEEIYKVQNYLGASSAISISPEGSSKVLETVFLIQHGKFTKVLK